MKKRLDIVGMVKKFQCCGCSTGNDPKSCEAYKLGGIDGWGERCLNHAPGTFMGGAGRLAIGLPRGFNRYGGPIEVEPTARMVIRLFPDSQPRWDKFNVPVWKLAQDGFLFVRCYAPRNNAATVDVVQGDYTATEALDNAIDVAPFHAEMD